MFFLAFLVACNDCSYFEACDGDTLMVCGSGVDQQVGRTEHPFPCSAPNDVCLPVGEANATCASSEETCTAESSACNGDVLVECAPFTSALGLYGTGSDVLVQTSTDCAVLDKRCVTDEATETATCG